LCSKCRNRCDKRCGRQRNARRHSADQTASWFVGSSWPPVFALVLDYDETNHLSRYFKKIPAATGGLIVYPASASKLQSSPEELPGIILSPFTMTLQLAHPQTDPGRLKEEGDAGIVNQTKKSLGFTPLRSQPVIPTSPRRIELQLIDPRINWEPAFPRVIPLNCGRP